MSKPTWYCCRQRAGPLVKECRALRPRFDQSDSGQDHREKSELKRYQRGAVNRKQTDRLELMIALLGWTATHYTLTFEDRFLPDNFRGVRLRVSAFLKRLRRWFGERPFDYIYAIEGLHGDHRYHVHFVCDAAQLPPVAILMLWRYGIVEDEPILRLRSSYDQAQDRYVETWDQGFRVLAEYLTKERTDGVIIPIGRHPWSCSRSLREKLPPLEKWTDDSGVTVIPEDVIWSRRGGVENDFGAYFFTSYIEPDESLEYTRACARARARTRSILKSSGYLGTNEKKGGDCSCK